MRRALVTALVLGLCAPQVQAFEMREECRYYAKGGPGWSPLNVKSTARCAARRVNIEVNKFLSVVSCESGFQADPAGGHPTYHSPMQYLPSTFASHYEMFPDFVRWNRLRKGVHYVRSTVMVAARYVRRHGYGPWSCA